MKSNPVQAQIDGVEKFLQLEIRSRVLDLACGSGVQTVEFARRGHRVLGIDPAEKPFSQARQAAKAEGLKAHFLKHDTRQISYRAEFDAVVSLSSAFGRFENERDDERALTCIHRSLKPRGKLLIDLLNKEWLMRHFDSKTWEPGHKGQGEVILEQVTFNFETGRLDNHRTTVSPDGKRTNAFESLRLYTLVELKALLARSGLTYSRCWGGYDGSAYGMDSPRLIVLAEKPVDSKPVKREDDDLPKALRIKGRSRR